jgi:hypothetical protein
MDVEAQIAVARIIIEVEATVAEVELEPGVRGLVDGAHDLPVDVGADAKAADIAIGGHAEAVAEIPVIMSGDQRIGPAVRAGYGGYGK